jgi:hypothetical protein
MAGASPSSTPSPPGDSRLARWRERFDELPRAARWLIVFGACMVAYFAVIEPVLTATALARGRAEEARDKVAALQTRLGSLERAQGELASAITELGPILPLGEQDELTARLRSRISEVITARGFTAWNLTQSRSLSVSPSVLGNQAVPAGRRVVRAGFDITLEGSPEAVLGVIADLEQSPEVTLIRDVVLRRQVRDGKGFLSATISPEVWALESRAIGGSS